MKIQLVEAELFHADRRTDGQTWRSSQSIFAVFANAPNKWLIHLSIYELFWHKTLLFLPYIYRNITEPTICSYVFLYPASATEIYQLVRTLVIVLCYQFVPHSKHFLHYKDQIVFSSNKTPTRCNNFSILLFWHLFTAQHVLGVLTPIIRSSTTAVAASGFIFGAWW